MAELLKKPILLNVQARDRIKSILGIPVLQKRDGFRKYPGLPNYIDNTLQTASLGRLVRRYRVFAFLLRSLSMTFYEQASGGGDAPA